MRSKVCNRDRIWNAAENSQVAIVVASHETSRMLTTVSLRMTPFRRDSIFNADPWEQKLMIQAKAAFSGSTISST